ncbi:MAG: hypothetical protein SF066_01675 [Thermoanaerobaculia bacterium]|nr:hypothetical protein [Thermoanaerobaculia bacterium]
MHRLLPALFLACFALVLAPGAFAQVTDGTNIGNLDQDRARTKEIRDARQVIDDYPAENWRTAAYLLIELTPNEDGSATLTIAEKDRLKLLGIKKAEPQTATSWLVADPDRIKLQVNYYQTKQEVACSVPKKLRGQAVTLGIFKVYESQVECFVRLAEGPAASPSP